MATLAESFLADLEELEEDEEYGGDGRDADAGGAAPARGDLAETLKYDNLDSVAPLVHSERYRNTMQVRARTHPRKPSLAHNGARTLTPHAAPPRSSWRLRWPRVTSRPRALGRWMKTRSTRCGGGARCLEKQGAQRLTHGTCVPHSSSWTATR
jgi:hypothetical protein